MWLCVWHEDILLDCLGWWVVAQMGFILVCPKDVWMLGSIP